MAESDSPGWVAAATSAAVRLAAEAGAEVDEALDRGDASRDELALQILRLQQSADISEAATDLAVLLWAECEDVPPIATLLEEPQAQAALHAVAEARRQAAARLAIRQQAVGTLETAARPSAWDPHRQVEHPQIPVVGERQQAAAATPAALIWPPAEDRAAPVHVVPGPVRASVGAVTVRRPGTGAGAVLAGAAAAIVLFGRRLRRA